MGHTDNLQKKESFVDSISGKNIPILTLDNKWYRLLNKVGREEVKPLETKLNDLLKEQGKITTTTKDIKKVKKRLMEEIVALAGNEDDKDANQKIAENKRLVDECNEKLAAYDDAMLDLPMQIDEVNKQLMVLTMEHCYDTMQEYTDEIQEIEEWTNQIRIELKKRLIRKQEMETHNHEIYAYMHDIFGADVVDLFDLRYNPEEKYPRKNSEESN